MSMGEDFGPNKLMLKVKMVTALKLSKTSKGRSPRNEVLRVSGLCQVDILKTKKSQVDIWTEHLRFRGTNQFMA